MLILLNRTGDGCTPLFKAVCNGHADIVAQLIAVGCYINLATTKGWTPLFVAAKKGHDDVVAHLIQRIKILSVTLAAEEEVFLSSLKKGHGSRAQQLGAVVDSGATRHAGHRYDDVLTFLPNSFLMYPAIGPPVKMPAVLLSVPTVTHAGVSRTLSLLGVGVYDPTMREGLVSIAQLLAARYHVILRLPAD